MIYKNGISRISFGCMRLPKDVGESEKLIMHALDLGINYFDTAYIYPGSEKQLGKIMERNNCRDKMMIATKLPHYLIKKTEDFEKFFKIQLERLQTDYVDYYLMHMLPDVKTWENMKSLGVLEWIDEKKKSGAIKHIGFSYHGGSKNFVELIDAFEWEFAQVQYNYVDENSQAGRVGVEYAAEKNIPVFIMEPLRGGLLVDKLPSKAKDLITTQKPSRSPAEWALRWLWDQGSVTSVLSGMNAMDMIDENARVASDAPVDHLTEEDKAFYKRLQEAINDSVKVGCTGCAYCMPCPFGVNIPTCFRCYNSSYLDGYLKGVKEYTMTTAFAGEPSYASLCRQCGKCLEHCPQSIEIPKELAKVKRHFENPIFKGVRWYYKHKMLRQKDKD